jgi:hypothetical protein
VPFTAILPSCPCPDAGSVLSSRRLPVFNEPDGAMRLNHLSQRHPDRMSPYQERMRTEDIGHLAVEGFEVVERDTEDPAR